MNLSPEEIERIAAGTLDHYNQQAEQFWHGTKDHDVSQNMATLLQFITTEPPFDILDLGCGPGRDLKAFADLGHRATGLDGSPRFATMAREFSRCEVLEQSFVNMSLPAQGFDGVFANASLFHVPSQELPRVLRELHAALKPGGVLFSSNPRGEGQEGWSAGRYGVFHDLDTWRNYLLEAGFTELLHYYRPPGLPRQQQPWLASVWRKQATD
jgi:SAM-dependent methyltransferase